ncbi:MAG: lysoplasmalogenase family protein [Kofleriaceae bacterium]
MLIILTVICAASCLALVGAEVKGNDIVRAIAKLMASGAFVMIGLEALHASSAHESFAMWILIGLVLGAVGDILLLGRSNAAFLAGLVAFLGGHVAYIVAATRALSVDTWLSAAGVFAALPIVAGGVALFAWLWPHLSTKHRPMRAPVIVYVIAIVMMVVAAIAVARAGALPEPQRCTFVIGAALFFVSDLAVARDKFVSKTVTNRMWGLPTYFAGQLLIAWTLIGL